MGQVVRQVGTLEPSGAGGGSGAIEVQARPDRARHAGDDESKIQSTGQLGRRWQVHHVAQQESGAEVRHHLGRVVEREGGIERGEGGSESRRGEEYVEGAQGDVSPRGDPVTPGQPDAPQHLGDLVGPAVDIGEGGRLVVQRRCNRNGVRSVARRRMRPTRRFMPL